MDTDDVDCARRAERGYEMLARTDEACWSHSPLTIGPRRQHIVPVEVWPSDVEVSAYLERSVWWVGVQAKAMATSPAVTP